MNNFYNHLVIFSYNMHLCLEPERLMKNIYQMVRSKNVSIFCLQEVVKYPNNPFIVTSLLKILGDNWKATYHVNQNKLWKGMGNCIVWNSNILTLQKTEMLNLPFIKQVKLHESIFSLLISGQNPRFQRQAIINTYKFHNRTIRIINTHLDHIGGITQRKKQLVYLLKKLKQKTPYEIICGDFNTFDLLKTGKETGALQTILGTEYEDASKNSEWTADLYKVNLDSAFPLVKIFMKYLHIHIRRKLDYIWVKGLKKVSFEKLGVTGSDHSPLIVGLKIN